MKSIIIQGIKRELFGKSSTKNLRKNNMVPCVIYGYKKNIHFSTNKLSFKNLIYTSKVYTVSIKWPDNKETKAILQDVQFHPVSDIILHADFFFLKNDKLITMSVPIKIIGKSIGILQGGILEINLRKIKIKSTILNIPEYIEIDISKIGINKKIFISDLYINKCEINHPKNTIILSIRPSRIAIKEIEKETQTNIKTKTTELDSKSKNLKLDSKSKNLKLDSKSKNLKLDSKSKNNKK